MHHSDESLVRDGAETLLEHGKRTPISRKLFHRPQLPSSEADDDFYGVSPPPSSLANLKDEIPGTVIKAETGCEGELHDLTPIDDDRLKTLVISSSEDETDHLERFAQAFPSSPNPKKLTTPPFSRPRSARPARRRHIVSSHLSDSNLDSDPKSQQLKSPTKPRKLRSRLESGRTIVAPNTKELTGYQDKRSLRSSTISQRQRASNDPFNESESSATSSDDIILTTRRKMPPVETQIGDSDNSDIVRGPKRGSRADRVGQKPASMAIPDDSDVSSEEIVTPVQKRRLAKAATSSPRVRSADSTSQTTNDLQEDVAALKDTELRSQRTRATNRTPKKTKKQEQLEILKRRRAGQKVVEVSSTSDDEVVESPSSRRVSRDEAALMSQGLSDDLVEDEDNTASLAHEKEDLDQYDEDFVVKDEDDPLGVPYDLSGIPLEFTRHAHKKRIEHFKDAVEWMIHNKLNPAFPRDDPVYQVAIRKLDDEVKGLAGSKFMSAAWNADFLSTLKVKPDIAYLDAPGLFEHHCGACNKSNHPAKFQLIFSGKHYDRTSLENISDVDEDDDGIESQDGLVSHNEKTFYVGRTCCANAETAHALHHWRYALNHFVLDWLVRRGHTTPEKIVDRERWSTKKRSQYANDVVDEMEASGEMMGLYKEFKENLQAARDARVSIPSQYL